MTETKKLQVFLCHAAADKPRVRELYTTLQKRGIAPWLDSEDLLPGQDWKTEIPKAIHNSDVIIVCLTKNSITKEGYVQKEIAYALDKAQEKPGAIFIIPTKLEECDTPERLTDFQWVDLHLETGHQRLMRSLKSRVQQLQRTRIKLTKVDEVDPNPASNTIIQNNKNDINIPSPIAKNRRHSQIKSHTEATKQRNKKLSGDSQQAQTNPATYFNTAQENKFNTKQVSSNDSNIILLTIFPQRNEVEVDETATYELEIVNAGRLVASFILFIEGVPIEWVSFYPEKISLDQKQRKRILINITPPKQPESTAGQHILRVNVLSDNYPDEHATVLILLRIKPYYEFALENLSPREQNVRWPKDMASTCLTITNFGNCPANFVVSAIDDENGCFFDFVLENQGRLRRQAILNDVPVGQILLLPIEVSPYKRPLFAFTNRHYSYTMTAQITNLPIAPQMVGGSITSRPLFGWWAIISTILISAIMMLSIFQPTIYDFQIAAHKDIIEAGDSTKLVWSVSPFADLLSISNNDQIFNLNSKQTSIKVTPTETTTYEFTASNWLSSLLNMDRHQSRTVLVTLPSPTINVFSVDNTRVAQGKPVHISWSVTQADHAFLTIDNIVTELSKEKLSGEEDVVIGKDSLITLEAKNTGGYDLRSYFINVEKPNINVVTFTVWVAPDKTGLPLKNRVVKLDAPSQTSPDPNFPEKYVELIPDKASDNGYRANFYQPDRQLTKGEQVLVEWNISGVDNNKIKIAPFTDELPSKGSQAYFPKESMNFILTAKSGTLEKIFMLPVKVFGN